MRQTLLETRLELAWNRLELAWNCLELLETRLELAWNCLKQFLRSDSCFCWFYGACMNFSFSQSMKKCDTSHGFAWGVAGGQGPPHSLKAFLSSDSCFLGIDGLGRIPRAKKKNSTASCPVFEANLGQICNFGGIPSCFLRKKTAQGQKKIDSVLPCF